MIAQAKALAEELLDAIRALCEEIQQLRRELATHHRRQV